MKLNSRMVQLLLGLTEWSSLSRMVRIVNPCLVILSTAVYLIGVLTVWMCYMPGHFCPALARAVKTMKKGEKVLLTVKPQCKLSS